MMAPAHDASETLETMLEDMKSTINDVIVEMTACDNEKEKDVLMIRVNGLLESMERYKASEGGKDRIMTTDKHSEERKVPDHDGKETAKISPF